MISYLKGILELKKPPLLIIELNGVGYECQAPMSTFYHLPETGHSVFLYTHFAVREDAHTLYGFFTERERSLFRSLIKVSNVGPKLALAILSGIEPDHFVHAIHEQDITALTHIPGVGKKTAERLIIEMRDRLHDWGYEMVAMDMLSSHEKADRILQDATSALVSLGFKPQEASRLISLVQTDCHSAEDIIRLALQSTIKGSKYDNNGSTDKRSLPE
jgi:holliday junction DNA helicase RuvA